MKRLATLVSLLFATLTTGLANPCPPPFLECPLPTSVPCGTPITFTPPISIDLCCGTNLPVTALSTTTNGIWPQFVHRVWQATDCRGQTSTCTQTVAIVDNTPPTFCVAPTGNLVPNPSFEVNIACPSNFSGQIILAPPWTGANAGSSDYYHTCALHPDVDVPVNLPGNQVPHGGQAYAGIHAASTTVSVAPPEYREYIQAQLSAPLVAGHTYSVSFYVSLSDFAQKAVDNLGAYLSVGPVSSTTSNALGFIPQVRNPAGSFLTDKINWTLIQGEFVAAGGERYVTIGNFYNNADTPTNALAGTRDWAYYYIDDVQVAECCPDRTVECRNPLVFEPPAAIDTCSGTNVTVTLLTGTVVSNNPCAQVHRLVWQAADQCSNTVTCTQLVTVVDTTPPVVNCTNKTVECGTAWTFDPPMALDACCGTNLTLVVVTNTTGTGLCPREFTRTWRVTDCCSNSVTCTQTVSAVDTTPPVVLCPQGITVATCSNSALVYFKATATDACDTNVLVTCTPPSGSLFLLGTNVVVCTATDDCGNTNICVFRVEVLPGTNFWQSFPGGFADCYLLPNEPAYRNLCLDTAYAGPWKDFDDGAVDSKFGFTWELPSGTYLDGWLHTFMSDNGCSGGSEDDTISLGLVGCGPTPPPSWIWTRPLGPSGPDPGLQSSPWCNIPVCDHLFSFHLSALTNYPSGETNVISQINATLRLDMLVRDDTRVDSARLLLQRCPPQDIIGGLAVVLTGAVLVYGPGNWTLARDAGGTNFQSSLDLGSADGVRLTFENLVFAGASGRVLRLNTTSPGEQSEAELLRLSSFGTGLVRFQLGQPPPGTTQIEVRTLSNSVAVASNTLPATAGVELARFPATASILQAGASRCGNLFVVVSNGSTGTVSYEARWSGFPVGYVFPRMATASLGVDGFQSVTLGRPELALSFTGSPCPSWLIRAASEPAQLDPFLAASGDAIARAENGQLALSALEAGRAAPMSFAADIPGSGSNEFRVMTEATFGQFSPVPSNASLSFALTLRPGGGQQDETVNVSFDYEVSAYWTVNTSRGGAPLPLQGVSVWNDSDAPVVELQVPASVSVSKLPTVCWPSTGWFIEADTCHRFIWNCPVTVRVNGTDYAATELRLLTGTGGQSAASFKSLRVETTGAESLVLSQLETGPITYRLEPPVLDRGVITIRGNTLGAVFESAPTVGGPWSAMFIPSGESRAKITNTPPMFYRIKGR